MIMLTGTAGRTGPTIGPTGPGAVRSYVVLVPLELREDDFDVAGVDLVQNFGTQGGMDPWRPRAPPFEF